MSEASVPKGPDLSPTRQRWRRFLRHRRGAWSLRLLLGLYGLSLAAEMISNDRPLLMRVRGRLLVPWVRSYTQDQVLGNGIQTRMTDYRSLWRSEAFRMDPESWVVLPPVPVGPHETLRQEDLDRFRRVTINVRPMSRIARVQRASDGRIVWAEGDVGHFFPGMRGVADLEGHPLSESWPLPEVLETAIRRRLENRSCGGVEALVQHPTEPALQANVRLAPFASRNDPPVSVRLLFRHPGDVPGRRLHVRRDRIGTALEGWPDLSERHRERLTALAARSFEEYVPPVSIPWHGTEAEVDVTPEPVSWPFRPVPGHWMGIDMAGRDVLARVLYGLRTSLTFGLLLVGTSLAIGILAGGLQGYFAGWTDILGQRLTEIWSALPFLYVMILLGNALGRSFGLLLACYAAFNWIGMSMYVRAEYLRLRVRPFVDAARSQGLGAGRIMLRHILPNALTPLITLFPFELVGAVGALAALDYLGFGLPDGTPSLGELLRQAQLVRQAWWLILYPSLTLFAVMILGVFVGEGLRDAFDPKEYSRLE